MPKRRLTKAKTRQQERREAEIRRLERLLAPAASGRWYEAFNPDPFRPPKKRELQKRDPRDNLGQVNQVKKQEKQQNTRRHDWEGTGADDCIFFWLDYYGAPLPPHPEEGNRADLERAVKEIFERKGCRSPSGTTLHDHIQKCIKKIWQG
jgi:hypothetical protein